MMFSICCISDTNLCRSCLRVKLSPAGYETNLWPQMPSKLREKQRWLLSQFSFCVSAPRKRLTFVFLDNWMARIYSSALSKASLPFLFSSVAFRCFILTDVAGSCACLIAMTDNSFCRAQHFASLCPQRSNRSKSPQTFDSALHFLTLRWQDLGFFSPGFKKKKYIFLSSLSTVLLCVWGSFF